MSALRQRILSLLLTETVLIALVLFAAMWLQSDDPQALRMRFIGEVPLVIGTLLAALLSAAAYWPYSREAWRQPRSIARALPSIRAAVVFLIVLMLTGPVLQYESIMGELRRVIVLVDGSQSMSTDDDQMSVARKLLIAQRAGWIDDADVDTTLLDAASLLTEIAALARQASMTADSNRQGELLRRMAELGEAAATKINDSDSFVLPPDEALSMQPEGAVTLERWDKIDGDDVSELRASSRFPEKPDFRGQLTATFETKRDIGDKYGIRVHGYLFPPETGSYTFHTAVDDTAELLISENDDPKTAERILYQRSWTGPDDWQTNSRPVKLRQGKRYYFAALMKEEQGADHLRVGWTLPSGRRELPLPVKHFSPFNAGDESPEALKRRVMAETRDSVIRPIRKLVDNPATEDDALSSTLRAASGQSLTIATTLRRVVDEHVQRRVDRPEATALREAIDRFDALSRWQRVELSLLNLDSGMLDSLAEEYEVEVWALQDEQPRRLWASAQKGRLPETFATEASGKVTDLSAALTGRLDSVQLASDVASRGEASTGGQPAFILLSDGQHNASRSASPQSVARVMSTKGVPLYTVGIGAAAPPEDLAIVGFEDVAQQVYKDHEVSGSVMLYDSMPAGKPFTIRIEHEGKVMWEQELMTQRAALDAEASERIRRIAFRFPVKKVIENTPGMKNAQLRYSSVPVPLQVSVTRAGDEEETRNNEATLLTRATLSRRKMLMVDGRPRWEFRYVRNMFERDAAREDEAKDRPELGGAERDDDDDDGRWQVTALLPRFRAKAEDAFRRGREGDVFPATKEDLFSYDLIILGDVDRKTLRHDEMEWLREFVGNRGGGLVLMDGRRQHLRDYRESPLEALLPVRWPVKRNDRRPDGLRLTLLGRRAVPLRLRGSDEENAELWSSLPHPHWVATTEALPGTTTWVEVLHGEEPTPAVVVRRYGAGKVIYLGIDETWRWRYEVADKYQRPLWHQLADWLMEAPFHVQDDRVAVGMDRTRYEAGDRGQVRMRVFDEQGRPLVRKEVEAELLQDGNVVATVTLKPRENSGGVYEGETAELDAGDYTLRPKVQGIPETRIKATTSFQVIKPQAREGEMAILHLDEERLRDMAEQAGGHYFREEETNLLVDRLRSAVDVRRIEKELHLRWQYWWFVPIILLLTMEWVIRKRVGML